MIGIDRIAAERQRQVAYCEWTPEHDDRHDDGELASAAIAYVKASWAPNRVPNEWPFEHESWKPSDDPIRNLEKAGALIAAEIDRLERLRVSREDTYDRP